MASDQTTGGMPCPDCGSGTAVYSTRHEADGSVRRRRRCLDASCGRRVTTHERIDSPEQDHLSDRMGEILERLGPDIVLALEAACRSTLSRAIHRSLEPFPRPPDTGASAGGEDVQ